MIDIRLPIGLMFSVLGVLLLVFGLFTAGSDIYLQSFGFNVNLWVGLSMLIFGGLMLFYFRKSKQKSLNRIKQK